MDTSQLDFLGRLRGLLDTFGAVGLLLIVMLVIVVIGIAMWRGVGLILLLLFLSYSTGAINRGGIVLISTIVRWGCLGLLGLALLRNFRLPRASMFLFIMYSILGLLFSVRSPFPMWSLQRSVLLMVVVIFVPLAVSNYITSYDRIAVLFKMGIIAATVWVIVSSIFLKDFIYSSTIRFTVGDEMGAGRSAYAGAFFAPLVIWSIIQDDYKSWKIFSTILIVPYTLLLLLGGVRTAIFGMLIIGSFPLLLMKVKLRKLIGALVLVLGLIFVSSQVLFLIAPDRAAYLFERIFSVSTTGRTRVWLIALQWCVNKAGFFGFGTSSAGASVSELGLLFHNSYLQVWYNTGFFGLILVVCFFAIYFLRGFYLIRKTYSKATSEYARTCFGYILGIAAMGMFEGVFASAGGVGVFMLLVSAAIIDRIQAMDNELLYNDALFDENFENDSNLYQEMAQ